MIDRIGRTVLMVRNYDEAVEFYRDRLGFQVIFDQTLEGGYRAVHIGLESQPGVGLWLMRASNQTSEARVGNQTGGEPLLVLYTSDCRAACAKLERRGVRILERPAEDVSSVFAHFADLYGNRIVLVELREEAR